MWAIEDSPGPTAAYRGSGIILLPAILLIPLPLYRELVAQNDIGVCLSRSLNK